MKTTQQRGGVAPGWQRVTDATGAPQYLPAVQRQPPPIAEILPREPDAPAALMHAWQTPTDGMMEHTSSVDRAKGVVLRSLPVFALVALLAIAGALIAYALAGQTPAVLTFLFVMAGLGGVIYWFESRTEYAHSRHGVERLRIIEGADIEHARMEHEFNLRRMALDAYIKIMERHYADN